MAPRQATGASSEEEERARLRKKLDGYEAMGLDVAALRSLLDEDLGTFKETYLATITAQLEGGTEEEAKEPEPAPEAEPAEPPAAPGEGPVEEGAPVDEEEAEEELELQLEGAGPEEGLLDLGEEQEAGEEEGLVTPETAPEEEVRISIGTDEVPQAEGEPSGEEPPEEAEPSTAEEAEIEVAEKPAPAEEAIPEEGAGEALIVVGEETAAVEVTEADILLEGITPEGRAGKETEEVPPEEIEGEEEEIEEPGEEAEEPGEEAEEPGEEAEEPGEVTEEEAEPEVAPAAPPKAPTAKVRPRPRAPAKAAPKAAAKPPSKAKPKVRPAPATVRRRRGLDRRVAAAILVAVVVIAGIGSYFTFFQNEPPVAVFYWNPDGPVTGSPVRFDGGDSYDPEEKGIDEYKWAFGDGTTGKGKVVDHTFASSGTFSVRLTVTDARGASSTTTRSVTVAGLTFSMAQPRVGDTFDYNVVGRADVYNFVDGLISFKAAGRTYTVYEVDAVYKGTKTFQVTQMGTASDGFMKVHDVRVEHTNYDLSDVRGNLSTDGSVNPRFTGTVRADLNEDVCLQWERTVRSTMTLTTDFSAALWADLTSTDSGTFYTQLDGINGTFSLDEFLRLTPFSSDDQDPHNHTVGNDVYVWRVQGMEHVSGRSGLALRVNITMDKSTLQANNLDRFYTDVWLEEDLSQPVKYHVNVKGRQGGNAFVVDHNETLTQATGGAEDATGVCQADHSYTVKGELPETFDPLGTVPAQGGAGDYFKFSPEEALDAVLARWPNVDDWLGIHPTAFCHLGNYTELGANARWTMLLGQKGVADHREVQAVGPNGQDLSTSYSSPIDDKLPTRDPASIGEVVTLTQGLRLMRAEPSIRSQCFDDQTPDWSRFTLNITEAVDVLSLDPTSALSGTQHTGYIYMLVSRQSPRVQAALDATNGQVLFYWTHSHTFKPLA